MMPIKKKRIQTLNLTTMKFIVVLKQVDGDAPQMFIKVNDFTIDEPIYSIRHSEGRYTIGGFAFDGEGLLPLQDTVIYFGNGNETGSHKWYKLETNSPTTNAQEISIYTNDGYLTDGNYPPLDNLLNYVTLHIEVLPTITP